MKRSALIEAALRLAKQYPVFPTNDKRPVWSNAELGVPKGEGGYKIATRDPEEVRRLFSHAGATEIAVPMGSMSGLICVDADVYKSDAAKAWVEDNWSHLNETRSHRTRSGGLHFIFRHPVNAGKLPAQLEDGVDLKSSGNGYVCWPPTDGYSVVGATKVLPFPMELVTAKEKRSGDKPTRGAFNDQSDDDLINSILTGEVLYPALRALSYRLSNRRDQNGQRLSSKVVVDTLETIMRDSAAAKPGHQRHEDWLDRYAKIEHLVSSASGKSDVSLDSDAIMAMKTDTPLVDTTIRPIGPQRETTPRDIERRVGEQTDVDDEFIVTDVAGLRGQRITPIEWIIPGMIPAGSTVSLGGTSNVGKTRWIASLAVSLAVGDTARMGLPQCTSRGTTLWIANEERVDDIRRRLKAVALQNGDTESGHIVVRGKDAGMLRLVAVNEVGSPEIDEGNVAKIVATARRTSATLIVLDPYVTLSDAMDENSATSAAVLTKAFLLLSNLTGAAVLHAHHTPKDRSKDNDWYRGDSGAWRGSGAIYSALDCGFTLSHWMPRNTDQRKAWKASYLEKKLSRWVVLDTGKIREGEALLPVIYELVGQELDDGEGMPIGVCRLSSEVEAGNCLLDEAVDTLAVVELAEGLAKVLGEGAHRNMTSVHAAMKGHPMWFDVAQLESKHMDRLNAMLGEPVVVSSGRVWIECDTSKTRSGKWSIIVEKGA